MGVALSSSVWFVQPEMWESSGPPWSAVTWHRFGRGDLAPTGEAAVCA